MTASVTNLSILSYPDGFIFYEFSQNKMQKYKLELEAPVDFPDRFEEFVTTKGWATNNSVQVNITEHSDRFLLLPLEVEDIEQKRTLFDFIHAPIIGNIMRTAPLSDGKQQFCYEIPYERLSCYKRMFTKFMLNNDAFALTEWVLNNAADVEKSVLLTSVYKKSIQLFAANPSGILFVNSFQIQSISEMTYYILRCLDQTKLNPFVTDCVICSETEIMDKLTESISSYIKHIVTAELTPYSKLFITPIKAL